MNELEKMTIIQNYVDDTFLNRTLEWCKCFLDKVEREYTLYTCFECDTNIPINALYFYFSNERVTLFFNSENVCSSCACY